MDHVGTTEYFLEFPKMIRRVSRNSKITLEVKCIQNITFGSGGLERGQTNNCSHGGETAPELTQRIKI